MIRSAKVHSLRQRIWVEVGTCPVGGFRRILRSAELSFLASSSDDSGDFDRKREDVLAVQEGHDEGKDGESQENFSS